MCRLKIYQKIFLGFFDFIKEFLGKFIVVTGLGQFFIQLEFFETFHTLLGVIQRLRDAICKVLFV